ncbi:MAG: 1-deoxy-D-xylulose-5-phosphate reductoisomerase [Candidatus Melainabacteria bacterium]
MTALHRIAVLGSTGSIGTQVLDIVAAFPERFHIECLSAGRNMERLAEQMQRFQPSQVCIQNEADISRLKTLAPDYRGDIRWGEAGLADMAAETPADMVIVGIVGIAGLVPSLKALKAGKTLLTANKETFVTGGHLVAPFVRAGKVLPLDSEHSAIHQCLKGENHQTGSVARLYLTASGGPFRHWSAGQIARATREEALNHPNWTMGSKITIDSATLMNKGLEVIEARWLFDLPPEKIQVVIHPQSIIHSAVAFNDGSILAQMGSPDMHGPLQYAMTYPERLPMSHPAMALDLLSLSQLDFEPPDPRRFPCLQIAYDALNAGSAACTVLNAADEVLVAAFLNGQIAFAEIPRLLEATLSQTPHTTPAGTPDLPGILALDAAARQTATHLLHTCHPLAATL